MYSNNSNARQALLCRFAQRFHSVSFLTLSRKLIIESLERRLALDGTDPLSVLLQAPDGDNHIAIQFNRPVTGVDLSDFRLTLDDAPIDFASAQLEAVSAQDYVLSLPTLELDGEYLLQLLAGDSGIADEADPLLLLDADGQVSWLRDTLAPSLDFSWSLPTVAEPTLQRIAALGDSQTTLEGNSYVPYLRDQLSADEFSVEVFAEAGWKASQVQGLWDSSVKDANFDVAIFFAGVNDLNSTDQPAETIFATLSTMFDEALARDMRVIAVGVSPWSHFDGSSAAKQARGLVLNDLIAQYASEHPAQVSYIDSRSALASLTDASRLATRYDASDGLHLSSAGDRRLASLIQQAIEPLRATPTSMASVTVTLSEPVVAVSAADFQLTRNGELHPFTATELAAGQFRFDFEVPADDQSDYQVEWIGATPIVDLLGNPLQGSTSSLVTIDQQSPTATMTSALPAVSDQLVDLIDVQFSEPVTGLSLENFQLTRGDQSVDLSSATLTELTPDHYQLNLAGASTIDGNYRLVLNSHQSAVSDQASNLYRTPSVVEWVQLATAPTLVDGLLTIASTSGTESVELNIFSDHVDMWIGGSRAQYSLENVLQLQFSASTGRNNVAIEIVEQPTTVAVTPWLTIQTTSFSTADHLTLYGLAGDDTVQSSGPNVMLSNSLVQVSAFNFAIVDVYGDSILATGPSSANDSANFVDTSSTERFIGRPNVSGWTAPTYQHWVHNFQSVTASSSGGSDTATLYDSTGDDAYSGNPTQGLLNGSGYSLQVDAFPVVSVIVSQGQDSAVLTGSTGIDTFLGQPQSSALYGTGYRHNLSYFDAVEANGNGGSDIATLYDSPAADTVELSPFNGSMAGATFTNVVKQFPRINAFSRSGADTLTMIGSAGNDSFSGQESSSTLVGSGYGLYAFKFPTVIAVSTGGSDIAKLYDSVADDRFDSTPTSGTLTAPNFTITAQQFSTLYAYARAGNDLANLSGSSAAETYNGYATYGSLVSNGRTQFANGFDNVNVTGAGGADLANLYDSNDNDTFTSTPNQARLLGPGFQHTTIGFPRTNAYARAGYDVAELNGSEGSDQFNGQVTVSSLTSGGVANFAYAFDRVTSNGLGGNDLASIYDSTGDDTLVATAQSVTLQSGTFSNTARGYSRSNVYARSGFDTATLVGTPAVETFSGQVTNSSFTGSTFANYAYAFDAVTAESGGGADVAYLYDSSGDDMLLATSTSVTLSGAAYRYTANSFSRVNAYGRSGNDLAQLIGSSSSETVVVRPDYSYIKNAIYLNYTTGFDTVIVTGGGGNDTGHIYDSAGNDQLMIGNRSATMLGSGYTAILSGFYRINGYASSGYDRVTLSDTVGNDSYTGRNKLGTLTSSGFTANLDSFDTVVLAPAIGGTNTLDIADLTYILEVGLGWQ